MTTVKNYKFLIEKPSKDDLFDGGSHSRTADAVFNTLIDDNKVNVVGIEGELGSGKSTVLELVKATSENHSYEFIEFDVERYQHGATKKALIEKLYKSVVSSIDIQSSKDKVKRAKDIALGNQFEYTAQVNSNINIWIVWFTIALLVGMRMLPDALTGIGNFIMFLYHLCMEGKENAFTKYAFSGLSMVAVFLMYLPWHIVRCSQKRKRILGFFGVPPSTGDLFKRNSTDKITESIEINKEVGAYELQEALQVFVSELPEDKRLILVLDNLDRVTNEKLREVWSDIEVFTSIAQDKIQLVIPYSISHVASSLSSENSNEGIEYISKRIPISFRVAPILSADWKNNCASMINEAGVCKSESEITIILNFIDTWTYAFKNQVTPRYLKKLINSVVSILIANNESINASTAFFYQLLIHNCNFSLENILTSNLDDEEQQAILVKNINSLEKISTFETWSKQIVSIHYLSNYDIAESELLTSPLQRALDNNDIQPFLSKQKIYAYDKILQDLLVEKGTEKIVAILSLIKEENSDDAKAWFEKWLPIINRFIEEDEQKIENIDELVSSYETLQSSNVDINLARVKRLFDEKNDTSSVLLKNEDVETKLKHLYLLSQIIKCKPHVIGIFNAEMYSKYLWPNRDKYPNWKIEQDSLNEKNCQELFKYSVNVDKIDESLLKKISSCYHIGWLEKGNRLKQSYPDVANIEDIIDGDSFVESNIYSESWYVTNQFNYYHSYFSQLEDESDKVKWLAQAIANIVYHGTPDYLSYFKNDIKLTNEFHVELANCLAVSCDMTKIVKQLENDSINEYLFQAVNILISNHRIFKMNISLIINKFNIIQKTKVPVNELLKILSGWKQHYVFSLDKLLTVNSSFFNAILSNDEDDNWRTSFLDLINSGGDADSEWWVEQIKRPNTNVKNIFSNWYNANNKTFQKRASLVEALKEFFCKSEPSELASFTEPEWIESILLSLPKQSLSALSRVLDNELEQTTTSSDWLRGVITNCGDLVSLPSSVDVVFQRHVLMLFENAIKDEQSANWFDNQNYEFEKWDSELFESFVLQLIDYEENDLEFEKLNMNRILSSKKSKLLKSNAETSDEEVEIEDTELED